MLKSVLFGNGLTIQFGGKDYLNKYVIRRSIANVDNGKFPKDIYPLETKEWLLKLNGVFPNVIKGEYDKFANDSETKRALADLKSRYYDVRNNIPVDQIGFEDYFLIHNLVCGHLGVVNPLKYDLRQSLKHMFLDSIYNEGNIQLIYRAFPARLLEFLIEFENIFTTNYDQNLEIFSGREVYHLHGFFSVLDDLYNPHSIKHKVYMGTEMASPILKGYEYLFSTALSSYSGESKLFIMENQKNANIAADKFFRAMPGNKALEEDINSWENSDNWMVRNLSKAIKAKVEKPELTFLEYSAIDNLGILEGELQIIGFSPINDAHIYNVIFSNKNITQVVYYFYNELECKKVKKLLRNKLLQFISVKTLWTSL